MDGFMWYGWVLVDKHLIIPIKTSTYHSGKSVSPKEHYRVFPSCALHKELLWDFLAVQDSHVWIVTSETAQATVL
ncbi:hypothetical protein E2C01_056001 [Portunus trituberculatus]|uniref:Uncharacterized protein n=1 Tax=Portunus trituberculatus TaxID=210409 RepID=A0A5B7GZ58_PORTR|nr:hypothetical protein [Portunus trituberculatus]